MSAARRPAPKGPKAPQAPRSARPSGRGPRTPPGARQVALRVLARVAATDGYLNVVLDAALDEAALKDVRDAALVTELCYGASRRQATLDAVLARFADRRLETLEDLVLAALRLGAYQVFFTRVPRHAAVADTVEALKACGLERAAGFANAVLRKVAALPELPPPPPGTEAEQLAYLHSHPAWLVARWLRHFGAARTQAMLAADNEAPALAVRANTTRVTRDELLAQLKDAGVAAHPTALSPVGVVLESPGRVEDLFGYAEGLFQVQDEAAQLVTVFAQVPPGARVLDACAAPGGKACHLAQTAQVTALELHANKLPKIAAEARRLGLTVKAQALDASRPLPPALGDFDVVFIDAPCSGLGTLRRHPELRWRRQEADLPELAALQRAILEACQAAVRPGGLLVYAVCTTEPVEAADQVELFLRSHPEYTTEPPVGLGELPTSQGALRTLPGPEGLDGFYAARLRKMY
jgi:16S rRNA (cytosine967-C5)-methyltransferase